MTERRQASAKTRSVRFAEKAIRAVVAGATRLIETLGPQPQLQPIPVRARSGQCRLAR